MAAKRIVIIGAGPAGCRAAETLAAAGLRPVVIDEATRSGGQIYRRPPVGFTRGPKTLYGADAVKAVALHRDFDALQGQIDYLPNTSVWGLFDNTLHLRTGDKTRSLPFDALILATGATDRVMPISGWDAAGVYSLGGAQIALKAQATAIGRRVVFIGSGPLLLLIAFQYARAGADVAAVLDTSRLSDQIAALPYLAARPGVLARGLRLRAGLMRLRIPVYQGSIPTEITSGNDGVNGVTWRDRTGKTCEVKCDAVGMGWHLRSENQLADLAACKFTFDVAARQWTPEIDPMGRSSRTDVYLAGDGARILGADGAEVAGRLSALAVLQDISQPVDRVEVGRLLRKRAHLVRFNKGLVRAFPWPEDICANLPRETVLCRCENVSIEMFRSAIDQDHAASGLNRAKAFSRVGMGRCQGRFCAAAAAEILTAEDGRGIDQLGRIRPQAPIRPLPFPRSDPKKAVLKR